MYGPGDRIQDENEIPWRRNRYDVKTKDPSVGFWPCGHYETSRKVVELLDEVGDFGVGKRRHYRILHPVDRQPCEDHDLQPRETYYVPLLCRLHVDCGPAELLDLAASLNIFSPLLRLW